MVYGIWNERLSKAPYRSPVYNLQMLSEFRMHFTKTKYHVRERTFQEICIREFIQYQIACIVTVVVVCASTEIASNKYYLPQQQSPNYAFSTRMFSRTSYETAVKYIWSFRKLQIHFTYELFCTTFTLNCNFKINANEQTFELCLLFSRNRRKKKFNTNSLKTSIWRCAQNIVPG